MISLCKNGQANPAYAMWSGNLVLGLAGLWVLRKVLKH
jgi:lipopolysaccharide export LptBFGC system permease protein LptF